jgi:hypothetical protein
MAVSELAEGRAAAAAVGLRLGPLVAPFSRSADVALEPFKKLCPDRCSDNEHVPPVVLVAFATEIAERTQGVQGAGDDGLADA